MKADLRLPSITEKTTQGQIEQIKNYLFQLVEQLNWILSTIDNEE